MNSLAVREFQQAIINFTNQSPLPLEVKRLCIQDIAGQLSEAANKQIGEEIRAREAAEKASVKDTDSENDGKDGDVDGN